MSAALEFAGFASGGLREALSEISGEAKNITEIRIRVNAPIIVKEADRELLSAGDYRPGKRDIEAMVQELAGHSLYAFLEEIRNGFITMPGGHRVGISGRCVVENGRVKTVKNVTSLCFRAARQIVGCSEKVLPYISDGTSLHNTIIISPPGCGKTTLLRDIIRHFSDGGLNVGVCDERGEIAGYSGEGGMDIGRRTDVLTDCPKSIGLSMLLRSMSPDILAADEVGQPEELSVIRDIVNAGVRMVITAHGTGMADLRSREIYRKLLNIGAFRRFAVLGRGELPGELLGVFDEGDRNVY